MSLTIGDTVESVEVDVSGTVCSLREGRTHSAPYVVQAWHGVLLSQRSLRLWHCVHAIGVRDDGSGVECCRVWRRRMSLGNMLGGGIEIVYMIEREEM